MSVIEQTPRRLVIRSRSTTVTLDKDSGKAVLQRKFMVWIRTPIERQISEIVDIRTRATADRASGVETFHILLIMATGDAWSLAAADSRDATEAAAAFRDFLETPAT